MSPSNENPKSILLAGTLAPDFTLPVSLSERVTLSDLRGRPVVLVFYPGDFSPFCNDQHSLYNELLDEFSGFGAEILGISVDGIFCHGAYRESRNIRYRLLADFEPKGAVARRYGVYHAQFGVAERALFVINRSGIIHWSYLSPMDVVPGADGILSALESLPK